MCSYQIYVFVYVLLVFKLTKLVIIFIGYLVVEYLIESILPWNIVYCPCLPSCSCRSKSYERLWPYRCQFLRVYKFVKLLNQQFSTRTFICSSTLIQQLCATKSSWFSIFDTRTTDVKIGHARQINPTTTLDHRLLIP